MGRDVGGRFRMGKNKYKKNFKKKDNCFTILVSAVYQHESAIGTHMSPPS